MAYSLKMVRRAEAEVRRTCPDIDPEDFDDAVEDTLQEWEADAAADRERDGVPEESPCLEQGRHNCNDGGTGEGQFHGRF